MVTNGAGKRPLGVLLVLVYVLVPTTFAISERDPAMTERYVDNWIRDHGATPTPALVDRLVRERQEAFWPSIVIASALFCPLAFAGVPLLVGGPGGRWAWEAGRVGRHPIAAYVSLNAWTLCVIAVVKSLMSPPAPYAAQHPSTRTVAVSLVLGVIFVLCAAAIARLYAGKRSQFSPCEGARQNGGPKEPGIVPPPRPSPPGEGV